jgi:FkbM family methyltransferase
MNVTKSLRLVWQRLPMAWRRRVQSEIWTALNLTWTLPSGVRIRMAHPADWCCYNEIFVNGDYDAAIRMAIATAGGRALRVADVGANAGFFTLRVADLLRQRGESAAFAATLIEASRRLCAEARVRVCGENGLGAHVNIVCGLAGERSGAQMFYESDLYRHTGHSVVPSAVARSAVVVDYVDLELLFADAAQIDLLKCDIEGAELRVIETYPELLRRVRVAAFELHPDYCDVDRCLALLRAAGLSQQTLIRRNDRTAIYHLWRPDIAERLPH